MKLNIDPTVDYAFKKLFGSEQNRSLLIHLLRAVLNGSPAVVEPIAEVQLVNPFNDKETVDDKLSILDIKARDQSGRWYDIEMQVRVSSLYADRALYYWARLYHEQLKESQAYTELRPAIAIHFLNECLFPNNPSHHFRFRVIDDENPDLTLSNHLEIHIIELPKFQRQLANLEDALDRWCYFLRNAENLDPQALPPQLKYPEIEQATEVLRIMDANIIERERYESRIKAQRDAWMLEKDAMEKGLAKGLEKGLAKGLEQGLEKGLIQGERNGLAFALELKFGKAGLDLMERIDLIDDLNRLQELKQALRTAATIEEFRPRLV